MKITLRVMATGRAWGDMIAETKTKVKLGKTKAIYGESDHWEGPDGVGGSEPKGQYYRTEYLIVPDKIDQRYAPRTIPARDSSFTTATPHPLTPSPKEEGEISPRSSSEAIGQTKTPSSPPSSPRSSSEPAASGSAAKTKR